MKKYNLNELKTLKSLKKNITLISEPKKIKGGNVVGDLYDHLLS